MQSEDTLQRHCQGAHKSAWAVTEVLLKSFRPLASHVHTLTYDNGREFTHHRTVAEVLDAGGYFAHPCHSWERGLNENTNGLIRQYLPKGTNFQSLTQEDVQEHHGQTQQPSPEMPWLQDTQPGILRDQTTCCTSKFWIHVSMVSVLTTNSHKEVKASAN